MTFEYKYVNFEEDHELNDHLKKHKKAQSERNREVVREMGKEIKEIDGTTYVTHERLDDYMSDHLVRLED